MSLIDKLKKRREAAQAASVSNVERYEEEKAAQVKAAKQKAAELKAKIAKSKANKAANDAKKEEASKAGSRLLEMLNKRKAAAATRLPDSIDAPNIKETVKAVEQETQRKDKHEITYDDLNEQQREAVDLGSSGKSFCLIGSAGSGKTTTQRMTVDALQQSGLGKIEFSTKMLGRNEPSILILSYMNKAVENMRAALPVEFKRNCMTIHKAVEYEPEMEMREYEDEDTGETFEKQVQVFKPKRNAENKLPHIEVIIMEESSTVGESLYDILIEALPRPEDTTFIFLGDLNQLPPVFGDAVLGYKLCEVPVVELTQVYRQDGESPIKALALDILKGKPIDDVQMKERYHVSNDNGECNIIRFAKRIEPAKAVRMIGTKLGLMMREGDLVAGRDMVLCPFNTGGEINALELNKHMGQAHSEMNRQMVYEIIAGRNKHYVSVGDIVYYRKKSWKVERIEGNDDYSGVPFAEPSFTLNRWGIDTSGRDLHYSAEDLLEATIIVDSDNADPSASHKLVVSPIDQGEDTTWSEIRTIGDYNDFQLGYCLTVYKSIGSEWDHVVTIFHDEHQVQWNRETLYTAVTRARRKLTVMYDGENYEKFKPNASAFQRGVINQQIKGQTLEAKINFFRAKKDAREAGERLREGLINKAKNHANNIVALAKEALDETGT